ncbi:Amidophosphoribosyltransferase, partial [Operophtera brumata]
YSTSAASEEVNCQPFVVHTAHGALAVAHNGELDKIYAVRDPYGNRPLCLGKILPMGSSYVYKKSSSRHATVLTNGCAKNGVDEKAEGWVVSSECPLRARGPPGRDYRDVSHWHSDRGCRRTARHPSPGLLHL